MKIVLTVKKQIGMQVMIKIPTKDFSGGALVVGALTCLLSFFTMLFTWTFLFRYDTDSTIFYVSFLLFIIGLALVHMGKIKVVDEDQLIIFLKDYLNKD